MFYENWVKLCEKKKVSRAKACIDCGLSRIAWKRWEAGGTPRGEALQRIADYFGVTVDYLLGLNSDDEAAQTVRQPVSDEDIKFALFGDSPDISADDLEDVRRFAAFIKESKKGRDK